MAYCLVESHVYVLQSQKRVEELEEQLDIVMAKTQRKVSTLKAQFQEHKGKWESVSIMTGFN